MGTIWLDWKETDNFKPTVEVTHRPVSKESSLPLLENPMIPLCAADALQKDVHSPQNQPQSTLLPVDP